MTSWTCLSLTFSINLEEVWCSYSKTVSHVSDQCSKCLWKTYDEQISFLISTENSDYAAKFCFASVIFFSEEFSDFE